MDNTTIIEFHNQPKCKSLEPQKDNCIFSNSKPVVFQQKINTIKNNIIDIKV